MYAPISTKIIFAVNIIIVNKFVFQSFLKNLLEILSTFAKNLPSVYAKFCQKFSHNFPKIM